MQINKYAQMRNLKYANYTKYAKIQQPAEYVSFAYTGNNMQKYHDTLYAKHAIMA